MEGLKNWYSPELASSKCTMIAYYTVYKNLLWQNSAHNEAPHRAYLHFKNLYRFELIMAKRAAVKNYTNCASNPCRAAWLIINSETYPKPTSKSPLI